MLLFRIFLRVLLVAGLASGGFFGPDGAAQCLPAGACTPGGAPSTNRIFGMGIFRVTRAALDTTTNGAADRYQEYGCRARAAQLVRGPTYTLAVRTTPNADGLVTACIDFDQNGAFSATELVAAPAAGQQHQASFTLTASAPVGVALRPRIAATKPRHPFPRLALARSTQQSARRRPVASHDFGLSTARSAPGGGHLSQTLATGQQLL